MPQVRILPGALSGECKNHAAGSLTGWRWRRLVAAESGLSSATQRPAQYAHRSNTQSDQQPDEDLVPRTAAVTGLVRCRGRCGVGSRRRGGSVSVVEVLGAAVVGATVVVEDSIASGGFGGSAADLWWFVGAGVVVVGAVVVDVVGGTGSC